VPDGVHFLHFVRSIRPERRGVYVGCIDRAAALPGAALFRSESESVFATLDRAGRGVLLSTANGRIEVRQFDVPRLRVIGDPTTIDIAAAAIGLYHARRCSRSPLMFSRTSPRRYRTDGVWPRRIAPLARPGCGRHPRS
jgi:hypothetical protein